MVDILFIVSSNAVGNYQELAQNFSAIEPPTWALLIAESCRSVGSEVAILDCLAEGLSDLDVSDRIEVISPRLICFVVYGQNVNAGTANMEGAVRTAEFVKSK